MGMQPRSCKCGYSPLSPEDKFCPMCKEPVARTNSRLASLQSISINRPRLILIGLLVCLVLMLSFAFILVGDWTKKGQEALEKEEYLEALKFFDWVQLIYPTNSEALYGKWDTLIEISKIPERFTANGDYFKQIIENNKSKDTYIYNLKMGDYYLYIYKNNELAESSYRKAVDLSSNRDAKDQAVAFTKIGNILKINAKGDENKLKESLNYFDKCINVSMSCSKCREYEAESYLRKGLILSELNHTPKESEDNYIRGLERDPKNEDVSESLCNYLNKTCLKTDNKEAKRIWEIKCNREWRR